MKKWVWLWLILTLVDAGFVIYQSIMASDIEAKITAFDFSKLWHSIPYWLDSIWYIFNIIAINGLFAYLGYLFFRQLKQYCHSLPNFTLILFLYGTFGALMMLGIKRFNIIYPSYLYHPFNMMELRDNLWLISLGFLMIAGVGYILLNIKYWKKFLIAYIALAGLAYYPYIWGMATSAKDINSLDKPNVIYILLDAVRPDHMKAGGAPFDIMPKLNKMIEEQGVFYKDVTVSVGRSFPSAVAILSGLHAINNGARDNLFAKEGITYDKILAHTLRAEGYQTIAANDAVQFWNLDEDYGFDAMWTAGQSSLKLIPLDVGGFMPLPLLFANTRLGELFFPYSYSDRNIDDLYDTNTYVNKIERNLNLLDKNKPLFLFMSMELTHTPYADETPYTKSILKDLKGTDYYDACNYFLASMNVLDDQLFDVLDVLKQYGRLDNTLLIIGSDHGQGFDMAKDGYITYQGKTFDTREGFYGNTGINASSTHLVLSMFSFMPNIEFPVGVRRQQIESIDIMPTITDLLGIMLPYPSDGESFTSNLLSHQEKPNKMRFVEPGLKANIDFKKNSAELQKLTQNINFDLNTLTQEWDKNGELWIQLNKDRAVYLDDWALMTQDLLEAPYVFNRKDRIVWPITKAPSDAPVKQMLKAWCGHYVKDMESLSVFGVSSKTIAQGFCMIDQQNELFIKLNDNELYNSQDYRRMNRKFAKSSQLICTREHLY